MNQPIDILHHTFGFPTFRPGQEEIVEAVIAGRDVLAILPTGGGKSLCFQLPALCREGVTVVVSPLIALMRDQVRGLKEAGVAAGCLTSGNTEEESAEVFSALDAGTLKILYLAPERLASAGPILARINVTLLAVDEAHCVSQWGHDFRPDYLRIGALRRVLKVPLVAFTATADEETRGEIVRQLFPKSPLIFLRGFDRPNLNLAFAAKHAPRQQLLDFVKARKGLSGIVYCATRAKTEVIAAAIRAIGIKALPYHAGLEAEIRREAEGRFQRDDGLVMVATIAFGMGVDKPDIRYVLHADLPKSVEAYWQEVGRAGRDGAPADAMTLFGAEDIRLRRTQIDESAAPLERKNADHQRLNALLGLAEALECRRKVLLGYFGEMPVDACGNCDLCAQAPVRFDATDAARKALSAVLRTGEYFGQEHLIDVLMGGLTAKVKARRHDELPTFGAGKEFTRGQWQAIFRQMLARDLLRPDPERQGGLRMTENARPLLRGEEKVELRLDRMDALAARMVRELVPEEDEPLLAALKSKRRELADAAKVPAYVIFNDRTLMDMAAKRPRNLDEMRGVSGIGDAKLERYGTMFLTLINGIAEGMHPARRKLAGSNAGTVFDRLEDVMFQLRLGLDGTGKPLACSKAELARVVKARPGDVEALADMIGDAKAERFWEGFIAVLEA